MLLLLLTSLLRARHFAARPARRRAPGVSLLPAPRLTPLRVPTETMGHSVSRRRSCQRKIAGPAAIPLFNVQV